jgi:hypothetical protein
MAFQNITVYRSLAPSLCGRRNLGSIFGAVLKSLEWTSRIAECSESRSSIYSLRPWFIIWSENGVIYSQNTTKYNFNYNSSKRHWHSLLRRQLFIRIYCRSKIKSCLRRRLPLTLSTGNSSTHPVTRYFARQLLNKHAKKYQNVEKITKFLLSTKVVWWNQ